MTNYFYCIYLLWHFLSRFLCPEYSEAVFDVILDNTNNTDRVWRQNALQETREQLDEGRVYFLYVMSNTERLTTRQRFGECSQTIIHDFPFLFSFFFSSSDILALFFLFLFSTYGCSSPPMSTSPAPPSVLSMYFLSFFH